MKITSSVRSLYDAQNDECSRLKTLIDKRISAIKQAEWHYLSRIKERESFALKLESGRFPELKCMEDFFGCCLVVENQKQIQKAIELVKSIAVIKERRPPTDKHTHKRPESFPFDDLRLYVNLKDDPQLPPTGLEHILFEVQIKTFLQHAWAIATHDLVYKTDKASWSKRRIAFQIKAMLEHAEVSIAEAEMLAKTRGLSKTDTKTKDILELIKLFNVFWSKDRMPKDVLRLASNVYSLIKALNVSIPKLKTYLQKEAEVGKGALLENISPYGAIVQSIASQDPSLINRYLQNDKTENKFRVFIPREVELPNSIELQDTKRAICT